MTVPALALLLSQQHSPLTLKPKSLPLLARKGRALVQNRRVQKVCKAHSISSSSTAEETNTHQPREEGCGLAAGF